MIKTLIILALFGAPALPTRTVPIPVAVSGVSGEDLADTPVSDSIDMEDGTITNQLSVTMAITAGTTLAVTFTCQESSDDTNWDQIVLCDTLVPSDCQPDIRSFTLANFTAAGGVFFISSRWPITKRYARCIADDAADGTGTVVLTGARSWR